MTISRRAFLASASAFSIMEGLASAAADKRIFAPNGGQAADFLICRRLYLDICGRIPTPEEVTEYVNSRDTRKREKLVDALLDSDDFADYYAMRYCDFLRVKSEFPINLWPNAVYVYHHWIRETIRRDMPWNDFARTLLYSRGSNFRVPQVNFLRATARRTPEGLSEAVSTSLLLDPTEKYAKYFSRRASGRRRSCTWTTARPTPRPRRSWRSWRGRSRSSSTPRPCSASTGGSTARSRPSRSASGG